MRISIVGSCTRLQPLRQKSAMRTSMFHTYIWCRRRSVMNSRHGLRLRRIHRISLPGAYPPTAGRFLSGLQMGDLPVTKRVLRKFFRSQFVPNRRRLRLSIRSVKSPFFSSRRMIYWSFTFDHQRTSHELY